LFILAFNRISVKRIILLLLLFIAGLAILAGWLFFGPATRFKGEKYELYISTGADYDQVIAALRSDQVIDYPFLFDWMARRLDYPTTVKAGKYEIKTGMSMTNILRMLRNGRQVPVNLVITKLRTKNDLAALVGKKLECDSLSFIEFLSNEDSLKRFSLDTNTVMTFILPNTYTYFWNTTPSRVFRKMEGSYKIFWNQDRVRDAADRKLTPTTAYILASIVEEETNRREDKGKVASVYLNRLASGMRLAADPTIKFALKNFELKRIYQKYLSVESPYNTYMNPGLPPGPICTPSEETIDSVITSPKTNYLYFVAKPDFSGYSNFAENFQQHLQFAKAYQKALDTEMKISQTEGVKQ
jgi:UPF0755 protein